MLSSIPYKQEIATFLLTFILLEVVQRVYGRENRVLESRGYQQMLILILAIYFTGVCHFTLLHRDVSAGMKYELSLFWSYSTIIEKGSTIFFREVVYNILLLLPMGMLLPWYSSPFCKLRTTVFTGFVVSLGIELCQLIFHLGLFEFDDIFNNALGALLGYSLYYFFICIMGEDKEKLWFLKMLMLMVIDVCVVTYFWQLWNQISG